jgi:micrococcal nuclease
MVDFQYLYKAKVVSVYDADTIRVHIDLGFGTEIRGLFGKGVAIRLYGINAPEIRGEEREQGIISRDKLRELILDKEITINTLKDKTGKYGRYLGILYTEDGTNINDWLVLNGYAKYHDY